MHKLEDVARRVGVSTATVSHVINGTRFVSPEIRLRVEAAIADLGYRPNALARALRSRRTRTIGLIVPDIRNPFYTDVTRAAEDRAQALGYSLILCNSDEDVQKESEYLALLVSRRVDAVLMAPVVATAHFVSGYGNLPVVILDRPIEGSTLPFVGTDNRLDAKIATEHLLQHGHRRLGVLFNAARHATVEARLAGFRAALSGIGAAEPPSLVGEAASPEGGRVAMQRFLAQAHPPTGIVSLHSAMTLGVLLALRERGLRCPRDIALVSFNNHDWAQVTDPPLTCVERESARIAHMAIDLADAILRQAPLVPSEPIPSRLIIRQSCGCAAPPSAREAASSD